MEFHDDDFAALAATAANSTEFTFPLILFLYVLGEALAATAANSTLY